MPMQLYRYIGLENLFKSEEGELHALELMSPLLYEDRLDAAEDTTSCRFEKRNGHTELLVYSNAWTIIQDRGKLGTIIRTVTTGELVGRYTFSEFLENPCNRIKKYVGEKGSSEYVYVDTSFDELFPSLAEGEKVYVSKSDDFYIKEV